MSAWLGFAGLASAIATLEAWVNQVAAQLKQTAAGASDPLALALFFVGGVLASLTPCVYPVIPIVVTYMSGAETAARASGAASAERRRRVLLRSAAYVLGMAVVYTTLGVIAARVGATFGALTQTFWAYAVVAGVLLAFALSLLGLYEIQAPAFVLDRLGRGPRRGWFGAALMGAASGVVAAPCAAPIVFPLLAAVGREGRVVFGALGMFSFSLGLGLLLMLLGVFSGLAASLPRPGLWMVRLKQALGVVMILVAAHFFYQGWRRW